MKNLELQDEAKLHERRQKLAELLLMEENQYRIELEAMQETPADKALRNVALARKHKEDREQRRMEYAQEQYLRKWRAGCDDLRTLDSEAYLKHVKEEQLKQQHEKHDALKSKKEEEEKWARLWEEDRLQKVQREEEEAAKRGLACYDTRNAITRQMAERMEQRLQDLNEKTAERDAWLKQLQEDARAAELRRQEEYKRKLEQGKAVTAWNDEFLQRKKDEKRLREEAERMEIAIKMANYQKDTQAKQADKEAMQREMVEYREYLLARKEEEKRLERDLERLTKEYLDKENARRDAQHEKEQAARDKLLHEVLEGRKQQLEAKGQSRDRRAQELAEERKWLAQDLELAKQQEEAEERAARQQALERRQALETQIRLKANARALEQAQIRMVRTQSTLLSFSPSFLSSFV